MKFMNRLNKAFLCSLLTLLLLLTTVLTLPNTVVFSAGTETPTITINTPESNYVFNSKQVVLSGNYTDNVSKDQLRFSAVEQGYAKPISDSLSKNGEWNINDETKTWTYTTTDFEEGTHNVTIKVEETSEPVNSSMVATVNQTFTVALTRPYVSETGIILPDGTEREGEDLTSVPIDAKIKVTVVDDQPMTNLKKKIKPNPFNPILMIGTSTITGTTDVNDLGDVNGKYTYEIIFTPDISKVQLNKSYLVYLDKGVVDDLDNTVFTKFFKVSMKSTTEVADPDNPHGHYQLNTNVCATCHTTHVSKNNPSLIGGSNQITFNEQLAKNQPADDPSQNFCMACHDGTTNAPFDKETNGFHHANPVDSSVEAQSLKQMNSCTNCHNPHSEWSNTNQNLLKDHYVYKHDSTHPDQGLVNATVDSLETPCDSCHNVEIDFSSISDTKGQFERFAYNKSQTAIGSETTKFIIPTDPEVSKKTISDYSLCLRCHNLSKKKQNLVKSDIESYYLQNSGHKFTLPANTTTQKDGSKLDGAIPCAECHDSHGSSNLYNLREVLGNDVPSDANKFSTIGTNWDDNERTFCLTCHKKEGIEIYGKNAMSLPLIDINTGLPISGHQTGDNQPCYSCHGGSPAQAAHAPQPGSASSN